MKKIQSRKGKNFIIIRHIMEIQCKGEEEEEEEEKEGHHGS